MARLRFAPILFLRAAALHSSLGTKHNYLGKQFPFGIQSNNMTTSSQLSDLSWKRIRVATGQDIDRLYPVLAAYIQNPALASTVTELVLDIDSWQRYSWWVNSEGQAPIPAAGPDEIAAHAQIEAYVRTLGLSKETTTSMLQALSWKLNCQPPVTTPLSVYPENNPYSTQAFASAASTLLLSLCHNIKLLHAYDLNYSPTLRDFLLRNNYGRLPTAHLQRLERVHLQAWSPYDNRVYDQVEFLDYFRFFGRLPAMHTLSGDAVMEYQANRDVAPPGSSPSITKISITNAEMSGEMLGTIIRVPRALEELTLSLGGLSHFKGGMAIVIPKTVGKCLLEQKKTLKALDLDIACMVDWWRGEEGEEQSEDFGDIEHAKDEYFRLDEQVGNGGPLRSFELPNERRYGLTIGSLHDFEALEHLAISVRLMLGPVVGDDRISGQQRERVEPPFRLVDALPRSLKSLYLYDYIAGQCPLADEHVEELKAKMGERFPFLTEVRGLDEPLIKNSQYVAESGDCEEFPSELSVLRIDNRGLDWKLA